MNEVFGINRCLMGAERWVMGNRVGGSAFPVSTAHCPSQKASLPATNGHGTRAARPPSTWRLPGSPWLNEWVIK